MVEEDVYILFPKHLLLIYYKTNEEDYCTASDIQILSVYQILFQQYI